jgi:hypothetical protein
MKFSDQLANSHHYDGKAKTPDTRLAKAEE